VWGDLPSVLVFCFRWHPRFALVLQALPRTGATLANQKHIADASKALAGRKNGPTATHINQPAQGFSP
jgi:hypothetical protein